MHGNVVLVTGASGSIGSAIGYELLAAGAEVILLSRSKPILQTSLANAEMVQPELLSADLTDAAAVKRVGSRIAQRGRLDALVLCSGIYERSNRAETFSRQMAANVIGPYALIQELLPALLQSQGQIVFINSSQALKAAATVGQYAATMHAAKAVADSLRDEVNDQGVRVMTLYLGRTVGERQRRIFEMEGRPYPPELLIQLSDVSQTVLYLLQMPRTVEVTDIMMRPMKKS